MVIFNSYVKLPEGKSISASPLIHSVVPVAALGDLATTLIPHLTVESEDQGRHACPRG